MKTGTKSLDLSGKKGCTTAGTFAAGLAAGPTDADFATPEVMGESTFGYVYIDTTAGDVTVTMAELDALTGVTDGDIIVLKKSSADGNSVIFTDVDGVANNFVNIQTEQYCVKRFGVGDWRLV